MAVNRSGYMNEFFGVRMKKQLLLVVALGGCLTLHAADWKFSSPDGHLQVVVSDEGGAPSYQVSYDGVAFLEKSPLGLVTDIGDFSQGLSFSGDLKLDKVDETYALQTIKQSRVHYQATEAVCS